MRASSSRSDGPTRARLDGPGLLGRLWEDAEVDALVDDRALLQAMLDAEAALAGACADAGLVPRGAAGQIAACCDAALYDVDELGAAADASGNPAVPLVRALGERVPAEARPWVHLGATSQDVLDTALVLLVVRAAGRLLPGLDGCLDACADLTRTHRSTPVVGRTLGQQAAPTTFGLKTAGWLIGLLTARGRLATVVAAAPAQLGGAVGTLAALGDAGLEVRAAFARRLGLVDPVLPWHTDRQPVLEVAHALGAAVVACGKVATDVGLMAQTEVGEVAEGGEGRGGSSAMPHKRNPVDAVLVTAIARRAPGLVGTLHAVAVHEHERAAGAWHAEWAPLLDLLRLTGGAVERTRRLLAGLEVHADRMQADLAASGGRLMAESVAARLAPSLGRSAAHDLVARAARSDDFVAALKADPAVVEAIGDAELDAALAPAGWLGSAEGLVDRALAALDTARATGATPGEEVAP